jgi:hypothetical protein
MFQATRDNIRKFFAWLLMLDDTPHSIAMGVAAGVFISFTPTVGLHMALVVLLSLFMRLNRTAGLAAVWLNNPLTALPVFFFNYLIGTWVLLRSPIGWHDFREAVGQALVFEHWYENLAAMFLVLGKLTLEVAGPLWLGSVIVATALAVPAYFTVRRLTTIHQKLRRETSASPASTDAKPTLGDSSHGKTLQDR